MTETRSAPPVLSVIVPAHDGAAVLAESLPALKASELPAERWELIVVDDGSADATAEVGERWADRVVRLPAPARGPAFARNRGEEVASGKVLVFVDADVCVHRDALGRLHDLLDTEGEPVAAFGAYDVRPRAEGLVSQYRNLLHHWVHTRNRGEAETFWAGLGGVRRREFQEVGGFDEVRYPRPQIEDIELGYRLRDRGHRIVLDPSIRGSHLKRWTLSTMIRNDLLHRGVPWMELLLERKRVGEGSLNADLRERVLTMLTVVGTGFLLLSAALASLPLLVLGMGCLSGVLVGDFALLSWFARIRGSGFAVAIVPLRLLYYLLNGASVAVALGRRLRAALRDHVAGEGGAGLGRVAGGRRAPFRGPAEDAVNARLKEQLELAFAPIDKRALGVAVGATVALAVWLVTVLGMILDPEGRIPLVLLRQFFAGYSVTWAGAFIGASWGFFVGFVAGWFLAFGRNFTLATWVFVVRARAEYRATRDFLDHI